MIVRPENPEDFEAVAEVVRDAFGDHGPAVVRLVEDIRASDNYIPELTLVARDESGVIGHVRVGKGAVIGAKSAVLQPVDDGAFVTGIPAIAHGDWRKSSALFGQLPSFRQRVAQLERRIAKLEETLGRWRKRKKGR